MALLKERTVGSTEFQRNVGAMLDAAFGQSEAIIVTNHGRRKVAIISADEYDALVKARRELAHLRIKALNHPQ